MENPFMNSHSIQINGGDTIFFENGDEKEDIKAAENFMKDIKAEHPDAKVFGSLKFGDFRYRVIYAA